jgi:membrane associated rhomboid family serine protease
VIPFADENPIRRAPWATLALIAACVLVYFVVQPTGEVDLDWGGFVAAPSEEDLRFAVDNAAIPCELVQGRPLTRTEIERTYRLGDDTACDPDDAGPAFSPGKAVLLGALVSLFLHGGITHLAGNMLFLWVFGNNLEDHAGALRYLLLFLVGGVVATAAHVAVEPDSTVPIIGASGAIAALMGAYLVQWPRARVKSIVFFGPVLLRKVQARWLLVLWVLTQLLYLGGDSNVAWAAHLGGFAFGMAIGAWWRARARGDVTPSEGGPGVAPAVSGRRA